LSAKGQLSFEMERVLQQQPGAEGLKTERVLELNAKHLVFKTMKQIFKEDDKDKLKLYSELLLGQALLVEGLKIDDPISFAKDITKLMK
ncbi:MAG: molecular chaperone HtpG, partial [Eggerthellaceae bacterium]|nr:molecular chaperone HtpG [Eggerthellaceae bacterium]